MAEENQRVVCRRFSLTVVSAENLPNVREVFKTKAYAEISIQSAEKKIKVQTKPDKENELNPAWNETVSYEIAEPCVLYHGVTLVIKVYCKRTAGDRYIGEVHMNVKDLFDGALSQGGNARLSLPLMRGSTEQTCGILNFSYSFGETYTIVKSDFENNASCFGGWFTSKVAIAVTTEVIAQVASDAFISLL